MKSYKFINFLNKQLKVLINVVDVLEIDSKKYRPKFLYFTNYGVGWKIDLAIKQKQRTIYKCQIIVKK